MTRYPLIAAACLVSFAALGEARRYWAGPAPYALSPRAHPARIEVRRPREDLVLELRDGRWRVPRRDDLADAESVELLLSGLRALEFGPAAARGEDAAAYGLGPADSSRVRVIDAGGTLLFDAWFGRRAFARSCYYRASDRGAIRLASGLDPDLLLRSGGEWREKRLMPGGCAAGLELSAGRRKAAAPPDLARELCALRASRFAEGANEESGGFERPLLSARAPDGRGFDVGERRGSERLVRVEGRTALLRAPAAPLEAAADLLGSHHDR